MMGPVLALGKFTPDHFSRFSKAFTLVEIDLADYFRWELRVQKRFLAWIEKKSIGVIPRITLRTQRSEEEFLEMMKAAHEAFREALRLFIVSSGRKYFDVERDQRMLAALAYAQRENEIPIFFEWGEDDDLKSTAALSDHFPSAGMALDLDYHRTSIKSLPGSKIYKLHGWHPARWMRRYGEALSLKLIKRISNQENAILILAHSGRVEEGPLFLEAINRVKG